MGREVKLKEILFLISGVLLIVLLILLCIAAILITKACVSHKIYQAYNQRNSQSWYDLAFKDDLTGLFNRRAYHMKIQELEKYKQRRTWLLLFDIDDFKAVNDTKGHLFGDEILVLRLIVCVRFLLLITIAFIESAGMNS